MNKLSVVLATYNEEKNIGKCLKSVKGLAGEIVVVDGGSVDKTCEIARRYGARVKVTSNPAMFHINKQKAIDMAKCDWILQLDADEAVTKELKDEISNIVGDESGDFVAYNISRRNYFLGREMKKTGMYPDCVIRLFKKGKAYLACKSVHEQMKVDGRMGFLKNDLDHYPYPCFSEYLLKSNRYTSLTAMEYEKEELGLDRITRFKYMCVYPVGRFLELFFRHKGFMDGYAGYVFSLYSGLHIKTSYIKYWEIVKKRSKK